MPVVIVYVGLVGAAAGLLSILKPLRWLGIRTRLRGLLVFAAALVLVVAGALWPASSVRVAQRRSRLDDLLPEYQFNEEHSLRVHAPADRVYAALKAVTVEDVHYFRTLMAIRHLPALLAGPRRPTPLIPGYAMSSERREAAGSHEFVVEGGATRRVQGRTAVFEYAAPASGAVAGTEILRRYQDAIAARRGVQIATDGCCRATFTVGAGTVLWIDLASDTDGARYTLTWVEQEASDGKQPMLDLLSTGFETLHDEPPRELVLAGIGSTDKGPGLARGAGPGAFAAFDRPGYIKVACNFRIEDAGEGWSLLTTETRVLATDPAMLRAFGVYWRIISPGSALIRREWLKAVRRRAES